MKAAGIPYTLAQYFIAARPGSDASSGYSMGELVIVRYKGKEITRYDNRSEYAKSCKWTARHGEVVFDIKTKIALDMLCKACKAWHEKTGDRSAEYNRMMAIMRTTLDISASDISSNTKITNVI